MKTIQEIIKAKQDTYKYFTEKEAIEAVKIDGYNLQFVKQQTEAICIEAVKKDGYTLKYVKEQTEAICIEAVKQSGYALRYVNESLFIQEPVKPVEWKTFLIETMCVNVPARFIAQYRSLDAAKVDNKTAIAITEIKLNFEIV